MYEQFTRTIGLIGNDAFEKLKDSGIVVFGIGGVGSHCTEALARSGVGTLYLIDGDEVSVSNINRQSIALLNTVGRPKTEVMKEKIAEINPLCQVHSFQNFILPENLDEFFSSLGKKPDYIIDAIDTVSTKIALTVYAKEHDIPIISSMGTGNKLHPEMFQISDIYKTEVCPLCRVMRRELKKREIPSLKVLYSKEVPLTPHGLTETKGSQNRPAPASIAFVPPVAGLIIAGEVIRDLTGIR